MAKVWVSLNSRIIENAPVVDREAKHNVAVRGMPDQVVPHVGRNNNARPDSGPSLISADPPYIKKGRHQQRFLVDPPAITKLARRMNE